MNKKAEPKVSEEGPDNGVRLFERDRGEIDEREELSGGEKGFVLAGASDGLCRTEFYPLWVLIYQIVSADEVWKRWTVTHGE